MEKRYENMTTKETEIFIQYDTTKEKDIKKIMGLIIDRNINCSQFILLWRLEF